MKNILIPVLILMGLALVGCGKKDEQRDAPPPAPQITYNFVNGVCQASNGQVVANTYCPGAPAVSTYPYPQGTNGSYQLINGVCLLNGQQVPINYCQQNQPNPNGQITGYTQCEGTYFYPQSWGGYWVIMQVNCSGTLCSGSFLYNANRQPVICQ